MNAAMPGAMPGAIAGDTIGPQRGTDSSRPPGSRWSFPRLPDHGCDGQVA